MAAFGIVAICPSTSVNDRHTFGYATERTSGTIFIIAADDDSTARRWFVSADGDIVPGPFSASDLSTTATAGFVYARSGDGAPTGTPDLAGNGRVPLYYDRTNEKLFVYNGAWVGVTLS